MKKNLSTLSTLSGHGYAEFLPLNSYDQTLNFSPLTLNPSPLTAFFAEFLPLKLDNLLIQLSNLGGNTYWNTKNNTAKLWISIESA